MQISNQFRAPQFSGLPELWNNGDKSPARRQGDNVPAIPTNRDIADLLDGQYDDGPPQQPEKSATGKQPGGIAKWMKRTALAVAGLLGIGLVGGGVAYGALGGKESIAMERAFHESAIAKQEYTNSQVTIDGKTYNGGFDPETGLGYILADTRELTELTADGPGKAFRNDEWFLACGLEEVGRWIGGHEKMNKETVDYIFTNGKTASGQKFDPLITVDNRQLARNHSNLNIKTGVPLPRDCTDLPADILNKVGEIAGDIAEGAGGIISWINPWD